MKRTQVIDDQSDYFASDSRWLNKDEKQRLKKREEELSAKRHSSRKDRKVTLDFAGRQVLETNDFVDVYNVNDSVIQNVHFRKSDDGNKAAESPVFRDEDFTDLVNPIIKETKQAAPKVYYIYRILEICKKYIAKCELCNILLVYMLC